MKNHHLPLTLVIAAAALAAAAAKADVNWTVPNTRAVTPSDVQFSEESIIPSRRVMLRTMNDDFDMWGPVSLYPVVRSPQGKLYYGFVRKYAGGTIGGSWISFTFPDDFRANSGVTESEQNAQFGDALPDNFADLPPPALAQDTYQVKWVVNNKLISTGDTFAYPGYKYVAPSM